MIRTRKTISKSFLMKVCQRKEKLKEQLMPRWSRLKAEQRYSFPKNATEKLSTLKVLIPRIQGLSQTQRDGCLNGKGASTRK